MLTHWSPFLQKLLNNLIKLLCYLLCRVYVWAINSPNGGHFEIHIPGSEYLEGIGTSNIFGMVLGIETVIWLF